MKFILLSFFLLLTYATQACPFCNSETATEIRASLFGPDLAFNLVVTIFPFIIFSVIVYIIYHGGLTRKKVNSTHKT